MRRWQVSLHPGWDHCIVSVMAEQKHYELIRPHQSLKDDLRTDIETPSVVAATENPRYVIRERDGGRAKAVSGERTPDGSLAPIHHVRRRRLDVQRVR